MEYRTINCRLNLVCYSGVMLEMPRGMLSPSLHRRTRARTDLGPRATFEFGVHPWASQWVVSTEDFGLGDHVRDGEFHGIVGPQIQVAGVPFQLIEKIRRNSRGHLFRSPLFAPLRFGGGLPISILRE